MVLESESSRCSECVRSKQKCNVLLDDWERNITKTSDWESIERQLEKLEEEEEKATAQAQEGMARVARLRKQRALLKSRKKEILCRELKYLDELDAIKEKEKLEREEAERRALDTPGPTPVSSGVDPEVDPSLLAAFANPNSFL